VFTAQLFNVSEECDAGSEPLARDALRLELLVTLLLQFEPARFGCEEQPIWRVVGKSTCQIDRRTYLDHVADFEVVDDTVSEGRLLGLHYAAPLDQITYCLNNGDVVHVLDIRLHERVKLCCVLETNWERRAWDSRRVAEGAALTLRCASSPLGISRHSSSYHQGVVGRTTVALRLGPTGGNDPCRTNAIYLGAPICEWYP